MANPQLARLMRLIKRTGEKAVVLDSDSEEIFVMLPLDKYEEMLDEFTPDDFNNPFFNPETLGASDDELAEFDGEWGKEQESAASGKATSAEVDYSKELNFENWNEEKNENSKKDEVSLSDVPHEEEEEKFYLEPVE